MDSCDKTPFDDEYFDVIVACMAYHHPPDKDSCRAAETKRNALHSQPQISPAPAKADEHRAVNTQSHGRIFKVNAKSDAYAQIVIMSRTDMV